MTSTDFEPSPAPQGYVTDATYAGTFFRELSPAWLNYARALNGVPAKPLDEPFTYLELGAGLAHSTVVNAAAFPKGEFHACDFNPSHIAAGEAYANALDVRNIRFHPHSFHQLLQLDLPAFDFIVLHGVYSWVGPESRAAIRAIVREKLHADGLVYLSYNCMPGWASEMPVRRLLVELASSASGDSAERTRSAAQALQHMKDRGLRFFQAHPEAARAVDAYARAPANYLAHEFLNETWEAFYSIDVAEEMSQAGFAWIGSATLADNHPMLVVGDSAAQWLKSFPDPRQLQLAIDFAANRRFRRDLFVHESVPRSAAQAARAMEDALIGSVADPRQLPGHVTVPRGQITFQRDFMDALASLIQDGPVRLGEAAAVLGGPGRHPAEIVRNLLFLVAGGALMPFARHYRYPLPAEVRQPAHPLVTRSLEYIIRNGVSRAIPSELLGNGVVVQPDEAIAIVELLSGTDPERVTAVAPEVTARVARELLPSLARLQLVV